MAKTLRDEEYWEELLLESELGVLRYLPPDLDIPVPTETERRLVREARRRYVLATGCGDPENEQAAIRAARDRLTLPEAEQLEELYALGSVLANEQMGDFVVAVTGLDFDTYVAVTYEDMVVLWNCEENTLLTYTIYVEREYLAATELIYSNRP
ncbi:hypothetical protein G6L37_06290 [Agrobacterium rubi]|nr:hypothetical protein [Agrobacterium rubi]NTF24971.1 hypothetical protein [Agrobacterium rubi]